MLSRHIGCKLVFPLARPSSFRRFSTISPVVPNLNFNDYTRVYRRYLHTDEFEFTIEDQAKLVTFTIPEDATVEELKSHLKEYSSDITSLKALSIDLAELANTTKLHDLSNETFYIILNENNLCKVMSNDLSEADKYDRAYAKKEETCTNAGLPFIEQQIILNYLKRVDNLNQEVLGKKLFADGDCYEGKIDKKLIIRNLLDGIINDKGQQTSNEEQLIHYYNQQKERLETLKAHKEILDKKAHKITKWKMGLGLLLLIGQFSFVGVGTYIIYSWDIMEPAAYFVNLGGSIALSAMYFKIYNDYSNVGFLKHYKEKELAKLYIKHGFPIEEMKQLEETISLLEKKIKSNILINL